MGRQKILAAVTQSICWMGTGTWDPLPRGAATCDASSPGYADRFEVDQLAFVWHSLGSRVVLDALERLPEQFALIADGLGRPWSDPLVEQRCRWSRTADDLRPAAAR